MFNLFTFSTLKVPVYKKYRGFLRKPVKMKCFFSMSTTVISFIVYFVYFIAAILPYPPSDDTEDNI